MTEQEIITRSRQGVLRAEADRVARLVGLTDKEMAIALGLSASYLHRLKVDQRISQDASERLLLLENLLLHMLDTFEGRASTALNWLRAPLRELDYQTPLQILDTVTGYTLVDRVLGRIDYGIFG
ncbi:MULTISPECIES: antitoxin Xre/MbcA/ParS toxin-binding domain-containing protein [Spirosoma]|nr:antitoxin Xre/MbcA/ParS toxin-binding domain-containing protein [Spirosoma sordidisoli]